MSVSANAVWEAAMNRQPSACDFCGSSDALIPYNEPAFCWYACPECTQLIEDRGWNRLVDRCAGGHHIESGASVEDSRLLVQQAEAIVGSFRQCIIVAGSHEPDPRAQYGLSAK